VELAESTQEIMDTHPANPYQSITDTKIEPTVVSYTHPVKEHFEDEPQAEELHEIMQSNAELTPCEELRAFQEQHNGVFSDHNACCYRHECRIVWNDWEKLRSNPAELTDEDLDKLIKDAEQAGYMEMYIVGLIDGFNRARAILRKAQER